MGREVQCRFVWQNRAGKWNRCSEQPHATGKHKSNTSLVPVGAEDQVTHAWIKASYTEGEN